MKILLTGGAGFIGSHICVLLHKASYSPLIMDNLGNSDEQVIQAITSCSGRRPELACVDLCDRNAVMELFAEHSFDAVIHLAGLKAVAESVTEPLNYYRTNVGGLINLCEAMQRHGTNKILFSSSATVYGDPATVPIDEQAQLQPVNPYGRSKLMAEQVLRDLLVSWPTLQVAILRYFNPVGAHPSGLIGENPSDIPNNLMPRICDVAIGKTSELTVYGDDYPTHDGSGVRDYIHISDLAQGHLQALQALNQKQNWLCCNLGTGKGYSVLEIINTFNRVNGVRVPWSIGPRRPGDIASCYADPSLARQLMGWQAEQDLEAMCRDSWNWRKKNPDGYNS